MAYDRIIIDKIFDYLQSKKFEKISSVMDLGDQDLNLTYEEIINKFKKHNIENNEEKFKRLKYFPSRPRVPSSTLWLSLGFKKADRIDLEKLIRDSTNSDDGNVYEVDLNNSLNNKSLRNKYDLVTDFGNNEHVFNVAEAFKTTHELCKENGLIWIMQNLFGGNGLYNFDLSYFELIAAANEYQIEDSFMIINKNGKHDLTQINSKVFETNFNQIKEVKVSYLFRKRNLNKFKFPYQGIGDSPYYDKFYELNNNSKTYDLKRFYIPRNISQIKTNILIREIIYRIKKKFLR